ncbi:MAG: hypothetical protein IPG63_17680 [Xanthomonadales bacterium]|nr:hypothetical protein [Xanthomonadales bacterium]
MFHSDYQLIREGKHIGEVIRLIMGGTVSSSAPAPKAAPRDWPFRRRASDERHLPLAGRRAGDLHYRWLKAAWKKRSRNVDVGPG